MDLRHRHFSVKMYAKMKELGPIGGGAHPARPPRSANDFVNFCISNFTAFGISKIILFSVFLSQYCSGY